MTQQSLYTALTSGPSLAGGTSSSSPDLSAGSVNVDISDFVSEILDYCDDE